MANDTKQKQQTLPTEIMDLIGQLVVATAKSTAPENKISLTSSRIAFDLAALQIKCREKVAPGLFDTLNITLQQMISAIIFDYEEEGKDPAGKRPNKNQEVINSLNRLKEIVNENSPNGAKVTTIEMLELVSDYNMLLTCRTRWKEISDIYMQNPNAWATANKALGDLHDILTRIEIMYGLIKVPKNINWDIDNLSFRKDKPEHEQHEDKGE